MTWPFPYAVKAVIQHEFQADHLNVWLTFPLPMSQITTPPLPLWLLRVDAVAVNVVISAWQDAYTLLLLSDVIAASPARVTVAYAGPNGNLQTTWLKDWEPFGPILSTDLTATLWKTGMILLWSGSVVSIPSGFALCDGLNGTPDLRDRFVVGAGTTYAPGAVGGALTHTHAATQASHYHQIAGPQTKRLAAGGDSTDYTDSKTPVITVPQANHLPPYYALCYIMKL